MSFDGPNVQGSFSRVEPGITRFNKGDSPIAKAYRGITHENGRHIAHIEVGGIEYSFDIDEVKLNDEAILVASAKTKHGSDIVTLSEEAVLYIQARRDVLEYAEVMDISGQAGGHYGHNPDAGADSGFYPNPAFDKS